MIDLGGIESYHYSVYLENSREVQTQSNESRRVVFYNRSILFKNYVQLGKVRCV